MTVQALSALMCVRCVGWNKQGENASSFSACSARYRIKRRDCIDIGTILYVSVSTDSIAPALMRMHAEKSYLMSIGVTVFP